MRNPDFVFPCFRQIEIPGHGFFSFSFLLIVQVADPDIGRSVGGILPVSDENGVCFIEDDSIQLFRIGDDIGDVGLNIDVTRWMRIGNSVRMGFDRKTVNGDR